jgi:hypothetical protein
VPLERLAPLVKKYDLGCLRLWQDELAEIVRLVRQLPDVEVRIESDKNLLTDVRADLPQLGQRVSYFSVTATRPGIGDAPLSGHASRSGACCCTCQGDGWSPAGPVGSYRSSPGGKNHHPLPRRRWHQG